MAASVSWRHLAVGLIGLVALVVLVALSSGLDGRGSPVSLGHPEIATPSLPVSVSAFLPSRITITVWNQSTEAICGIRVLGDGVVWRTDPGEVLFPGERRTVVVDGGKYEVAVDNCFGVQVATTTVTTSTVWILETDRR